VATIRDYEYSSPDDGAPDLSALVVTAAHMLGRRVIVWTVDDLARMQALAAMGVDGIISDRPDLLLAAFGL
jgi:glycerophosphoryl diester phosphodiesterase